MHPDDVTKLAMKIINESSGKKAMMSERFLKDNNPSIEMNDYLSDVQNLTYQLEQMYFKNTENRNVIVPEALEILQQIKDRTDLSIEKLKQSNPEDVNK